MYIYIDICICIYVFVVSTMCCVFVVIDSHDVCLGFIGKITLRIPLRCLHSQPWVINIDKLYVVIGPRNNIQVRIFARMYIYVCV